MDLLSLSFASILAAVSQGSVDLPASPVSASKKAETTQTAQTYTYILPNIAGLWELELDKADVNQPMCSERYRFDKDGLVVATSGQEFTYGKYLYTFNTDGLPAIAIKTLYDNNEKDCSGSQVDQTGEVLLAYVKVKDTTMQWCADAEGKQCTMQFHRILP